MLKFNTFFKVTAKLQTEAEKKAELTDLTAYDLSLLDVYILHQA